MVIYWIGIIVFLIGFGIRIVSRFKYAHLRMAKGTPSDRTLADKYKRYIHIGSIVAIIGLVINIIGLCID